ncbi:uncharacterized protein LOC121873322 isoform X2 [Homarus americanus]|uniref:uncharacterized protein LOC121873322 isoform X2 n=1 Tax=Homarus americanus TaxID=6706 RepID=UPI001C43E1BA|nr:uncharacterized protein LOC121873322 isoform X2 [Homarus americanus]
MSLIYKVGTASSIVSGDLTESVEEEIESPVLLDGQVVMPATKGVMEDDSQMIMDASQAVDMEGSQVVIKGSQVVMEDSPTVMEGSQVMLEESEFGASVLQDSPCHDTVADGPVIVKEEDLQDTEYGHNQQILGLVHDEVVENAAVDHEMGGVIADENTLATNQESEMLLRNLVSETFHSSPSTTHGPDNIIVTTSTITTNPVQGIQQPLTSSNVIQGTAVNNISGIPVNLSNTNTPTKIVVQTNQDSPVKANAGHFLIQVGGTPVSVAQPQIVTVGNKNHIVIRAGANQVGQIPICQEESDGLGQGSIFKVIIPEGTTKFTKVAPIPVGQNEQVRKHVQINLSDGTVKKQGRYTSHTSQTQGGYEEEDIRPGGATDSKRFYECPTCNSKFMRPLYLRKHMRSCKKEEVKVEKTPLYMCSFCKMTFKTRPQISQHFLKCYHSPYRKKTGPVKRKGDDLEPETAPPKRGKMEALEIDPALEQAVQFRCQDCDRTFSKERQYSSHIKKCTKFSVHDLSGAKVEVKGEEEEEDEPESQDDPFADPDPLPPPTRRGRGPGRRGRPPGRGGNNRVASRNSSLLFEGAYPVANSRGLLVADNEGLVRSTTGLAHTVQLSLETACQEGQPQPTALVADSKGVRGREKPPQAWSLVCALCQKMFFTKAALAHHVMSEHGADLIHTRNILDGKVKDNQPLFRCPVCSLNYQTEDQFIEHMVLQHTSRLQETFTRLQGQTATYVCSLCSLVLLTKSLLVEHMSLVHLDELETLAQGDTHVEIASKVARNKTQTSSNVKKGNESFREDKQGPKVINTGQVKFENAEDSALECGFCGEELPTQEDMVEHYIDWHGVETDEDGCLLDLGIDVDIRVKDTKGLLQLADGRMDASVPEKTVLIRKKPRQSWQCKECQQVFSKHFDFLRHVREVCTEVSQGNKPTVSRGGNFKCQEPGCSHLSFYQVKLLFKHMEEVHNIIVPREFKTFKNLDLFYQWLTGEEKKYNVRYIRDTTRIEKNDMKLIQMVCHRFHTAKIDQSKEKKEGETEGDSPSKQKRRWFVRIQRSSNCHARIHLKVQYNPATQDYDGETQMVYYPQHTHNEVDHPQDLMNRIMERHARDKSNYLSRNGNRKRLKQIGSQLSRGALSKTKGNNSDEGLEELLVAAGGNTGVSGQHVVTGGTLKLEEGAALTVDQYMKEFCQTQLEGEVDGTSLVVSTSGATGATSTVRQATRQHETSAVLMEGDEAALETSTMFVDSDSQSAVLVESGEPGTYVVQDRMMSVSQGESTQKEEDTEEYVLPADEAEWTKLFDVLRLRLMTSELSEQEKGDGEGLLSYQNVISYLSLAEQVTIFQQLCLLTNTAIETAD